MKRSNSKLDFASALVASDDAARATYASAEPIRPIFAALTAWHEIMFLRGEVDRVIKA